MIKAVTSGSVDGYLSHVGNLTMIIALNCT